MRVKTTEDLASRLEQINSNIIIVGEYVNCTTKIDVECKVCGHQWKTFSTGLLQGYGCPKCARNARKLSHEDYVKRIQAKSPSIEVLSAYISGKKPVKFHCTVCNNYWESRADQLLYSHNTGCPKCANIREINFRKLSHEEFIKRVKNKNSNIEPVSEYVAANKKMTFHCNACDTFWDTTPNSIFQATSACCPKCSGIRKAESNTYTHDEIVERVKYVNENITVIGEYAGCDTKIEFECNVCKNRWFATPSSVINHGCGCPKCAIIKRGNSNKSTHDEFIKKMNKFNKNVRIVGKYTRSYEKIEVECCICGYHWNAKPRMLLGGSGCPKCAIDKSISIHTHTHDEFIKQLETKNTDVLILDEYKGCQTKIHVECKKCGHNWNVTPNSLLNGTGCPKCAKRRIGENSRLSQDVFSKRVKCSNPNIIILGEYKGYNTRIRVKCGDCGYHWSPYGKSLLNGSGCPVCNKSTGEKEITSYLYTNNIKFETQKKYDGLLGVGGGQLSYDFYLPDNNLLIEYQGEQHERPVNFLGRGEEYAKTQFQKQQEHDKRKREFAKENNIDLLEIWYTDFDNISTILDELIDTKKEENEYEFAV